MRFVNVMAGLVPAIHVFCFGWAVKTWMPAKSAVITRWKGAIAPLVAGMSDAE